MINMSYISVHVSNVSLRLTSHYDNLPSQFFSKTSLVVQRLLWNQCLVDRLHYLLRDHLSAITLITTLTLPNGTLVASATAPSAFQEISLDIVKLVKESLISLAIIVTEYSIDKMCLSYIWELNMELLIYQKQKTCLRLLWKADWCLTFYLSISQYN